MKIKWDAILLYLFKLILKKDNISITIFNLRSQNYGPNSQSTMHPKLVWLTLFLLYLPTFKLFFSLRIYMSTGTKGKNKPISLFSYSLILHVKYTCFYSISVVLQFHHSIILEHKGGNCNLSISFTLLFNIRSF